MAGADGGRTLGRTGGSAGRRTAGTVAGRTFGTRDREGTTTMSDKVLSRTTAENRYPESERTSYLKELWELSRNRIRHALSEKRMVIMSAMKQSYLGKYTIVGGVNV